MAIDTLDRIATDVRDPRARSYIPLHRARRALMDGRAEETERLIDEGVKLAWSLHDSTVPILAGAQLFALRRAQGRLGELENAVHQFADRLPAMPAWRCALAVLYLDDGREGEARRELEHLAARDFADFPRDNVWMIAMASLAELCHGLEEGGHAVEVEKLLAPFANRNVVSPEGIFGGPVTRYLALCAAARADWDVAREYMAAARTAAERLSLGPTLALLDLDEAQILARRDGPGDAAAARALLVRARERSSAIGVPVMGGRLERVEEMVGATGTATASPAATVPAPAEGLTASLRREGDVWRVEFEGRTRCVKDAKGLRHLALLLDHPGVEFHAVDIVGAAEGTTAAGRAGVAGDADVEVRRGDGDAGALLDPQAKREYRARLEDLRAEIEEAEDFNDPERAARAREEMEFIARELSSAVGLGGRDRKAASNAERARVNVTRAVKGRHPPHRRRGREPRPRARDDRAHRLLLPLRARSAAPGDLAGRWRLSPGGRWPVPSRPWRARSNPSTSSSSARASAGRSPPAGSPRRAGASCSSSAGGRGRRGRFPGPRGRRGATASGGRARGCSACGTCGASPGSRRSSSSGLGGGSLIYANVALRKDAETFADDEHEHWPVRYEDLEPHYATVEAMQGARPYPHDREPYASTPKTNALLDGARRAGLDAFLPNIAVSFAPDGEAPGAPLPPAPNVHDAPRYTCRLCGECIVGCQYGAKNTLDYTYLSAARTAGATIRCCCEATLLAPADDGGWRVGYRQHLTAKTGHRADLLDPTDEPEREVRAGAVVLAAGTFGTTRLLLSQPAEPATAQPPPRDGVQLATATCCSSCATPTGRSTRRPARRSRRRRAWTTATRRAGASSSCRTRAPPPGASGCGRRPSCRRTSGACATGSGARSARGCAARSTRASARCSARRSGRRASRPRCCRCSAWAATCPAGA